MSDPGAVPPDAPGGSAEVLPETLLAVFNGIPGLVGYWDRDKRNVLANDAYLEWVGLTPAQMRGKHAREVLGEELYARNGPRMDLALAGEEQIFDRAVVDAQGRTRWTETSYIPDRRGGEVVGFFVLIIDISARVRAARAARRSVDLHRALARSLPSGFVLIFDEELRYSLADGVELSALGLSRRELEGRTLHEALPAAMAAEVEPHYRAALEGRLVTWETEVGDRVFRLTAGPVRDDDGDIVFGMVTAIDVTEDRVQQKAWRALVAIARDVARNASTLLVADAVAAAVADTFGLSTAAVVRFTGSGTGVVVAMSATGDASVPVEQPFPAQGAAATGRVLDTGAPATVRLVEPGDAITGLVPEVGHLTAAAVPVRSGSDLWGAISVGSVAGDAVDERLVERLGTFAELVELAIASSRSIDALEREAHTDPLTGLPNRRAFDERLARELERSLLDGGALSVAIMDVDHFKDVNDRFGHPVGDTVLREIADRVRAVSRDRDLVARIGGEEFGWIMPGTSGDQALEAAERLRSVVSADPFGEVGRLTVSLGVCGPGDLIDAEDLVARADEALYAAKRAGRDQVARSADDLAPAG